MTPPDTGFDPASFLRELQPWESRAGGDVILRGRRGGHGNTTLHFVHGNSFCAGIYWPLLRRLSQDRALFCHDLEGHGASDAPPRHRGPAHDAARIKAVIDEQQLARSGPLIGFGHSYGAALTIKLAAANPGLFDAVLLIDPILIPRGYWWGIQLFGRFGINPIQRAAQRRRTHWPDATAVAKHLKGRGIYAGWHDEAFACFVAHGTRDTNDGQRTLSCPSWVEAANFGDPVYVWNALPKLRCPVLLIHGDASYPFIPGAAQRAKRLCPQIELEIQRGGHCFMQEDPDDTATRIRAFLDRHGY